MCRSEACHFSKRLEACEEVTFVDSIIQFLYRLFFGGSVLW